jgi:RHS repeat-associated protein
MPGRYEKGSPPTQEDYTGHLKDNSTQLHYAGARYYSSAFGRWTTTDPILGEKGPKALLKQDARLLTMTSYNHTFGNPIGFADPDGEAPSGCPPFCGPAGRQFQSELRSLGREVSGRVSSARDQVVHATKNPDQVASRVGNELQQIGNEMAAEASTIADGISDVTTGLALVGVVAAPFTKGASLALTGDALAIGTAADAASTGIKGVEAMNGGSNTEFYQQGAETLINVGAGGLTKFGLGQAVTRTGSEVTGPLFRSSQTGEFVTDQFGQAATVAADATAVGIVVSNPEEIVVPEEEEDERR